MKALLLLFFFLFSVAFVFGAATNDDPQSILARLEKLRKSYPQEKVYIQLDRPYYSIGDTVWFKSYVVNAEKNQLSALSKILYVELINEKDSIKQSLRLALRAGTVWGDFTLADSLSEGNYRVRAYTNWMRNFSDEYFFDKTIRIGNALSNNVVAKTSYALSKEGNNERVLADITFTELDGKPLAQKEVSYTVQMDFRNIATGKAVTDSTGSVKVNFVNNQPFILKSGKINASIKLSDKQSINKIIPLKATATELKVQFFPEGGQLLYGIASKVAFKVLKPDGFSASVSGYIIDKDKTKLVEFKTGYAGMGVFTFQPMLGNNYKAVISLEDGTERTFDLPRPVTQGYALRVEEMGADSLAIKILASPDMVDAGAELVLISQSNHVSQLLAQTKVESIVSKFSFAKSQFPQGILQLTLFTSGTQPIAERLVFINHYQQINIAVSTNKSEYKKREKVQLNIHATNDQNKPVQGNFSLAVTKESEKPYNELNETTILTSLLLSSDLRGYIEGPAYYFTDSTVERSRDLDNLLLTQGWRRFVWKNLLSDTYPSLIYQPEQGIEISGRVVALNSSLPVGNGKVSLLASAGDGSTLETATDNLGRFRFNNLVFSDTTKFVLQARNQNGKNNVEIELDYTRPPLVTKNKNLPDIEVNVNHSLLSYLQNRQEQFNEMRSLGFLRKSILLAEVKITESKPVLINSSNLNGPGNADFVIKADDLRDCMYLAQCLPGRVPGLSVRNGLPYLTRNMMGGPMQVIIDGMYVEPQMFSVIDAREVESIELLRNGGMTALYGMRGGNGVLIITTKRAELAAARPKPGILSIATQGYYKSREFYSPDYDRPESIMKITDMRTTVYWNPTIMTDANGKATLEFFNAEATGTYKAVIEGINGEGNLGRQVYRYTVQ